MFEELEEQRGQQAKRLASGLLAQYGDSLQNTSGIYLGADVSLGTGFEYDGDGGVIGPPGGFWRAGMTVGSAPIKSS